MKTLIAIVCLGLVGCANVSPAGNAVLGAAAAVAIIEHSNQHRPPVYHGGHRHHRPKYCFSRPVLWNPHTGQPIQYATECRYY
jgi:hypothetical protein